LDAFASYLPIALFVPCTKKGTTVGHEALSLSSARTVHPGYINQGELYLSNLTKSRAEAEKKTKSITREAASPTHIFQGTAVSLK